MFWGSEDFSNADLSMLNDGNSTTCASGDTTSELYSIFKMRFPIPVELRVVQFQVKLIGDQYMVCDVGDMSTDVLNRSVYLYVVDNDIRNDTYITRNPYQGKCIMGFLKEIY